jgi:WhiB family redox-sensing transcriptional regulator
VNLADLINRPAWMDDANCKGMDPELFFPGRGRPTDEIKDVCRRCDVQAECLVYAMQLGEKHGIWGGKSERERRALRRQYPADGRETVDKRGDAECGTIRGYWQHRNQGTPTCDDCKAAYRDYCAEYRRRRAS